MGCCRQFGLLLWKNFVLQKRQKIVTLFEIGIPTIFAAILLIIRQQVDSDFINQPSIFPNFSIDRIPNPNPHSINAPRKQWTLLYTPNCLPADQVMKQVSQGLNITIRGYSSEQAVENIWTNDTDPSILGAVVFSSFTCNDTSLRDIHNLTFKIRLSSSPQFGDHSFDVNPLKEDRRWYTEFAFPLYQVLGPRENKDLTGGAPGYYREGFLSIQHAVSLSIIGLLRNQSLHIDVRMKRFPYPPYNNDKFVLVIQQQFPLFLIMSFVFTALNIVKDLVHEKERKLKESMKIMGLNNWLHWMAWFVKYFILLLISIIIMTIFFTASLTNRGSVIDNSNPLIIFLFLIIYGISSICFCFCVSVFFSKANSGATASGVLWFLSYFPYLFLQPRYDQLTWLQKILSCLSFNTGMSFGGQIIGMFEGKGSGIQWGTLSSSVSVDDDFTLLHVMVMLLFDSFLYLMVMWYVEAVFPGELGVPKPWYFPLTKSYWNSAVAYEKLSDEEAPGHTHFTPQESEFVERDPQGIKAGIQIVNLTKVFGKGAKAKLAVHQLSLNMYEGQISVLLGHNGAGKTTTMSMLTGLYPPSEGYALVNDCNIITDISSVRQSLGLCPQHDVLFDMLTVEEHLQFFSMLKGCLKSQLQVEVDYFIKALGLEDKRKALAKTLSGGMKRKLSVGIALVGKSKVIMLDEPTSGMDPAARRAVWDLLQHERQGRTILLTTHFMEEADLLGDRIAIMANGEVQCSGSPIFLKRKYGAGYHMTLVKDMNCDVAKVSDIIQQQVPQAEMQSNSGAELSYILPHESSLHFEALFSHLEQNKEKLGISSFGASVTTMEEVFLRVGETFDASLKTRLRNSNSLKSMTNGSASPSSSCAGLFDTLKRNTGFHLYLQQFYAMFVKRLLHSKRNWLIMVAQLIIPLAYTIITLVVAKTLPQPGNSPPLILTTEQYGENYVASVAGNITETLKTKKLSDIYLSQFINSTSNPSFLYHEDINGLENYLLMQGDIDLSLYTGQFIIASSFIEPHGSEKIEATAHFSNQPYHGPAVALWALENTLLKYYYDDSYNFTILNHPLPRKVKDVIDDQLKEGTMGFIVSFNLLFGMAFLASSFVVFLIKERATKAKHIQVVSGVHSFNFWLSTLIWDFINYLIPCVLILATFQIFGTKGYTENHQPARIMLVFFFYGWAMLPFMYLLSFLFTVPSTGFVRLTAFNYLSGVATLMAITVLSIPDLHLKYVAKALDWAFLLLPNYCLGKSLQNLYENYQFNEICGKYPPSVLDFICRLDPNPCCKGNCGNTSCLDQQPNYLAWESLGIGRMLVFMVLLGTIYFSILILLESGFLLKCFYRCWPCRRKSFSPLTYLGYDSMIQEDSDVTAERDRILKTSVDDLIMTDSLILNELTKFYGPLLAVDRLTLGVPQGECFGLLGINGAGKTSTFKMLTGDETVSAGEALLDGYSIKTCLKKVQQRLGYCPQFDALIDQMTGREILYMFARLRGVTEQEIPTMVEELLNLLMLEEYADKLCGNYSGGNKRKLSTAIALVGEPPIIFLDEPTTGMDPVARRLLWDALSRIRVNGKCIVLTSHSMEECEALCTRLAIMVNGQLKCLGSVQHLKHKFGQGYTLIAKVSYINNREPNLEPLRYFIESTFPGSQLKDIHQDLLHYHIPADGLSWAQIFGTMEKAKVQFNLEDYSVSQTSLEQVFLNFARAQRYTERNSSLT